MIFLQLYKTKSKNIMKKILHAMTWKNGVEILNKNLKTKKQKQTNTKKELQNKLKL